eukprot:Protomagalhaensia_wolfi_Nauph_80__5887@NODE_762_length_2021_cov_3039_390515_g541_i1_p3_GENE_NODE_762_length_2021_cov_3039_390515_g541_i1NODE_762_length_2021_cov_3039_390515_g541_i1_p3_ORF_typecomplete_len143_score22_21_NODE_762_length_2021_cov_3039_390515_g541_i111781606
MKAFAVRVGVVVTLCSRLVAGQFRPFAVDPALFFPIGPQGNIPPVGWMKRHGPSYEDRFAPVFGDSEIYSGRGSAGHPGGSEAAVGMSEIIEGSKDLEESGVPVLQPIGPPLMPSKQVIDIMRDRQYLHLKKRVQSAKEGKK